MVKIGLDGPMRSGNLQTVGLADEPSVQKFVASKFDWLWLNHHHNWLGRGLLSYAWQVKAAGKKVILRTSAWAAVSRGNWTDLYNDPSLYNAFLDSHIAQIREAGGQNAEWLYAVQFLEAEPYTGYSSYTFDVNHFITVWNQLYDDVKATFPHLRIIAGLEAVALANGRELAHFQDIDVATLDPIVRAIKKDGLHMYAYYPLDSMEYYYDMMLRYKYDPDVRGELFTTTWCSVRDEPWYGMPAKRDPEYAKAEFELAAAKGIPYIMLFAYYWPGGVPADAGYIDSIFFNEYEDDPSLRDDLNPYLYKQLISELLDEYAKAPTNWVIPIAVALIIVALIAIGGKR